MRFNCRWERRLKGRFSALDIAPAGGHVLAGTSDGEIIMHSAEGKELWRRKEFGWVVDVRCGTHGQWAVVMMENGDVVVYDETGELAWKKGIQFKASALDLRMGTNMVMLGNRYRMLRQLSIYGKLIGRAEVSHPVDFIRFAPGGSASAVGSEDGHITMLDFSGRRLWTSFVHRPIFGLDVAERASFIIAPSENFGIVALNMKGEGIGVYEFKQPIRAAEIDDKGERLIALDEEGYVIHLDREAHLLAHQDCGFLAEKMALDSGGKSLALAGRVGRREGVVARFILSRQESESSDFLEVESSEGTESSDVEITSKYLEID